MKKTLFQRLIPLLLVVSFLISTAEPVAAASITGDVVPSGVVGLSEFPCSISTFPDRYRVTYDLDCDVDNYWCTRYRSVTNSWTSYDLGTSSLSTRSCFQASSGSRTNDYYLYPSGRFYHLIDFPDASFTNSDIYVTFTFDYRVYSSSSSTISGYEEVSPQSMSLFCSFLFYDENFRLVGNPSLSCSCSSYSPGDVNGSWGSATYDCSGLKFPDGAAYLVPCFKLSTTDYRYTNNTYSYYSTYISPNMSCTLRCDLYSVEPRIDGIWEAKSSSPTVKDPVTEKVNFTSGGIQYDTMEYSYRAPTGNQRERHNLSYIAGENILTARSDGWQRDCSKVVDFGSEPQKVSPQYYVFLTDHFTRISDSPEYGTPVNLKIYDYSGDNLLASCDTSRQVYLALNAAAGSANDFFVFEPGTDNVWSDDDVILTSVGFEYSDALITGVSLSRYGPPIDMEEITDSYFLATLYSGAELYLIREGDKVPEGGSSGSEGEEGWFNLYDYDGETLIDQFWVTFPVTVKVKEDGFHLIDYQEDVSSWQYVYDGDGTYAGLTYVSADSDRFLFTPGTGFVLSSESSIYLTCKDDLTNSDGSGGSGGSGDSGDDSGGSSGDGSGGLGDLDGSGLDNSSGNVSNSGNKIDGVLGDLNDAEGGLPVLPDNFSDIISSSLTEAFESEIWQFMPWYDEQYGFVWDVIFVPTLAGLAACLVMYAVFGKAGSVG